MWPNTGDVKQSLRWGQWRVHCPWLAGKQAAPLSAGSPSCLRRVSLKTVKPPPQLLPPSFPTWHPEPWLTAPHHHALPKTCHSHFSWNLQASLAIKSPSGFRKWPCNATARSFLTGLLTAHIIPFLLSQQVIFPVKESPLPWPLPLTLRLFARGAPAMLLGWTSEFQFSQGWGAGRC